MIRRHFLFLIALGAMLMTAMISHSQPAPALRPIHVQDGILRYPDGSQVALFGTNYYPMSWYQYQNMKALGVDFRAVITRDVAEMKRIGVQVVRVHVFDREISDAQGALVDNEHLEIFDMLVDELNRQGVYFYMTSLCWWNSPVQRPDAFGGQVTKMGMIFNEQAVAASQRFVGELLSHKNRYTGRALKDEPCLAVIEVINEPWYYPYSAVADPPQDHAWHSLNDTPAEVYQRDLEQWRGLWQAYCKRNETQPTEAAYNSFQQGVVADYYKKMIGAIRGAGAAQPIAAALFETCYCPGVLAAIAQSEVDAVVDGWYPGGFDLNEYENLLAEANNYTLDASLTGKAKMIYEFDIPGTYDNVGMYPAMARRYRSMGAQVCTQFQYDSSSNAAYNTDWGVHYLNELYTPAKAVAFEIASRAFGQIPLGTNDPCATQPDRQVFAPFAVAFEPKQALMATSDTLMHAQTLEGWSPLPLPADPKLIVGRGNSALVQYDGSGFYRLERTGNKQWALRISPDVIHGPIDADFFNSVSLNRKVVTLETGTMRHMQLSAPLPQEGTLKSESGEEIAFSAGSLSLLPGKSYTLTGKAEQETKAKLIFVIDQGWGNGPINKRDLAGVQRTLDELKPLQEKYDVYPLWASHVANTENFEAILNLCVQNEFPFFLDVMSSDGMTLAGAPQTKPYDETHGLEIGLEDLKKYKEHYGKWLAGIRFMEIFGQDYMVINFDQYPQWQHEGYSKKPDTSIRFFDPAVIRPYLDFARKTGLIVQWSEFHWVKDPQEDPSHEPRLEQFRALLRDYPSLITVTYANNQPDYASLKRIHDWTHDVKELVSHGAKDFGLSDQSWIYNFDPMNCPPELIINWADSAFEFGCHYIQFEPGFFFFHYPMGHLLDDGTDYTQEEAWAERGKAREPFIQLRAHLLARP